MDIIKIWGSILAPKDKYKVIDHTYLKEFSEFMQTYFSEKKHILIHGAGSYGHWFVKKYWLTMQNIDIARKHMDEYFQHLDVYFNNYQRHSAEKVMKDQCTSSEKTLTAGDVSSDAKIISWDDLFAHYFKNEPIQRAFFLTDVNGVLDQNDAVIPEITEDNFSTITFWKKENDVTWSMEDKIRKLLDTAKSSPWDRWTKMVRIINGKNLQNFKKILQSWDGIWTKLLI